MYLLSRTDVTNAIVNGHIVSFHKTFFFSLPLCGGCYLSLSIPNTVNTSIQVDICLFNWIRNIWHTNGVVRSLYLFISNKTLQFCFVFFVQMHYILCVAVSCTIICIVCILYIPFIYILSVNDVNSMSMLGSRYACSFHGAFNLASERGWKRPWLIIPRIWFVLIKPFLGNSMYATGARCGFNEIQGSLINCYEWLILHDVWPTTNWKAPQIL